MHQLVIVKRTCAFSLHTGSERTIKAQGQCEAEIGIGCLDHHPEIQMCANFHN